MVGQRREYLRWGKWDMQEEPDAVAMAAVAQHLGERNEMIIVHLDNVVGTQPSSDLIGKMHIDAPVAAQIAAGEFFEIETVMEDRP